MDVVEAGPFLLSKQQAASTMQPETQTPKQEQEHLPSSSSAPLHPAGQAQTADQAAAAATAAAPATAAEERMEIDAEGAKKKTPRSSSRSSSTSERLPSQRQLHRTMRELRSEVDDLVDDSAGVKKQLLYTMHRQVTQERRECACQLILQGFQPHMEHRDLDTALQQREAWCLDLILRLSRCPKEMLQMKASHATSTDSLSRLTLITVANASIVNAVMRSAGSQKFHYQGATISLRRQTTVWDRLTSAPAKVAIEAVAHHFPGTQGRFKIDWKQGEVMHDGELIISWQVSVEDAKIKMLAKARYADIIHEAMAAGLRRLNFGYNAAESTAPEKGKGQGKSGKGKKKSHRYDIPVPTSSFTREPETYRNALGSLQLARFPFTVTVKSMRERKKDAEEREERQHRRRSDSTSSKRTSNADDSKAKRRAPTPDRNQAPAYVPSSQPAVDPWARASSLSRQGLPTSPPAMPSAATAAAAAAGNSGSSSQRGDWPSGTIQA